MKIIVIGATGTIGKEIMSALGSTHEVIGAGRRSDVAVDIRDIESIRAMYSRVGPVDAVLCVAGSGAWKPLADLSDEDFQTSLGYKLMGQVNVIRCGFETVRDSGSIAVTSGMLSRSPMPGSGAISLVNAGLEGFVRAAALEAPRGIRVNVVSPPWVGETLVQMGMDPGGGLPAATVAKSYVATLSGTETGQVLEPH
ncbi:MAG TPA: short chain dehydrogenase [Thermoanaerobaculia bacterium]|nr:short chain dehydrogenase [Thermoanaerobaculia bacterium]